MPILGKDLVLSRFHGETNERVPVLPLFQSFFANKLAGIRTFDARKSPHKVAMAQINLMETCGFDGIDTGVDGLAPVEACGAEVEFPRYGLPYTRVPAVTDLESLEDKCIPDPFMDDRLQCSLMAADEMVREIGETHFTQASLCGPVTLAGELMGLTRFIEAINRDDEIVDKILSFTTEVFERYIYEYFRLNVDALSLAEPICSADYISEGQFRKYGMPAIRKCIGHMRRPGKMTVIHMCGRSERILGYIAETPIDGVCADLDVSRLPVEIKSKTVIGTVSGDHLSSRNEYDVMKESLRCIDKMLDEKFVLASGSIIPMTTNIQSLKMLRTASEYHVLNER